MHRDPPWGGSAGGAPTRRFFFPAFDDAEVLRCIGYLAGDHPEQAAWADHEALARHRSATGFGGFLQIRVFPAVTLFFAVMSAVMASDVLRRDARGWYEPVLLLGLLAGAGLLGAVLATHRAPELRFQRAVAKARRLSTGRQVPVYRIARLANLAGKAARELFQVHQGRRLTWVSPPAVADRALALSFPLVDVELSPEASPAELGEVIRAYGEFLYFAAALEAAARAELIPKLRAHYAGVLKYRTPEPHDAVPERDALFLDPMRNHSRWAVARDFLYPLSSWLSLVVAVAALVVTLAK